jgi:hypothetical protein
METDPFEEFRKKKLEDKSDSDETKNFYEIPTEAADGQIKGLLTHRFTETKQPEVDRPSGFEATELGNGVKDAPPETKKPPGFESTSLTED